MSNIAHVVFCVSILSGVKINCHDWSWGWGWYPVRWKEDGHRFLLSSGQVQTALQWTQVSISSIICHAKNVRHWKPMDINIEDLCYVAQNEIKWDHFNKMEKITVWSCICFSIIKTIIQIIVLQIPPNIIGGIRTLHVGVIFHPLYEMIYALSKASYDTMSAYNP